jgi:hypothetical protein
VKSIEKKIDDRFSVHIKPDNAGFWVILRFDLLDNAKNKSVYHEKYSEYAQSSFEIKRHLRKSENDFMKKSKKVIEFIKAMESVFD